MFSSLIKIITLCKVTIRKLKLFIEQPEGMEEDMVEGEQDVEYTDEEDINENDNKIDGQTAVEDNRKGESPGNSQPLFENNDSWDTSTVKCQQPVTGCETDVKTPR